VVNALPILFAVASADATLIVVRQKPHEIIVGADSLRAYLGGATTFACKIRQSGNAFYAMAGVGAEDRSGTSPFQRILDDGLNASGTLNARFIRIAPQLVKSVNEIFEKWRQKDPELLWKTASQNSPLQLVIMGVENDQSNMFTIVVDRIKDVTVPINLEASTGRSIARQNTVALGTTHGLETAIRDEAFWRRGSVAAIQELIHLQADAYPSKVGHEAAILRITAKKIWGEKPIPECAEIPK
jgi:hypothetical protein